VAAIVHATINDEITPEHKNTYLNLCHAYGWIPSDRGLATFIEQIMNGLRNEQGHMHWQKAG